MSLTTANFKTLVTLSEQRDAIQAELEAINSKISSAIAGTPEPKATLVKAASPKKKGKRVSVKGLITDFLKAANGSTVKVSDLSKKLGIKNQSAHVWFGTTGKKIAEIKKVGAGAYTWLGSPLSVPAEIKPAKAKAKKAVKPAVEALKVEKTVEAKAVKKAKSKKAKKASANKPF